MRRSLSIREDGEAAVGSGGEDARVVGRIDRPRLPTSGGALREQEEEDDDEDEDEDDEDDDDGRVNRISRASGVSSR